MKRGVAVLGYGWVGTSMVQLFPGAVVYDPQKAGWANEDGSFRVTDNKDLVNNCSIAFICVPTPVIEEGKLDIRIVEDVVSWCEADLLVIRSTVNPGDTLRLAEKYKKNIVVQPEYLGETPGHPMLNPLTRQFMIIGGNQADREKLIELYTTVYNANIIIRQVKAVEAEVIKLTENRAIAFKVAQCQELYDVCKKTGLDYYTVVQAVYGDDPRFNLWFTMIFPHKRGFNSKCMPKDVYAWCAWAESTGYEPKLTRGMLEKNKDWIQQ